jgi:hypothetical protein
MKLAYGGAPQQQGAELGTGPRHHANEHLAEVRFAASLVAQNSTGKQTDFRRAARREGVKAHDVVGAYDEAVPSSESKTGIGRPLHYYRAVWLVTVDGNIQDPISGRPTGKRTKVGHGFCFHRYAASTSTRVSRETAGRHTAEVDRSGVAPLPRRPPRLNPIEIGCDRRPLGPIRRSTLRSPGTPLKPKTRTDKRDPFRAYIFFAGACTHKRHRSGCPHPSIQRHARPCGIGRK